MYHYQHFPSLLKEVAKMVKETLKTERKNLGAEVPGTHKCQRNKRDLLTTEE